MRTRNAYILLTLLSLALFLPGIATIPILDRDSAHFAQATRQMLQTGNYFQIRFQDKTRYQKPPGINWLQALSVKLFSSADSTKPWPYRIPSLLGGLFAVLLTFAMTRRFYSNDVAFISAALLASTLLLTVESHLAVIDACLLASIVMMQASLWGIYSRYCLQHRIGWLLPSAFWLAMSAGIVLKGTSPLVGLLTVLALVLIDKSTAMIKQIRPLTGIVLVAISSVWLLFLNHAAQSNYLWQMIQKDLLPKLSGSDQGHGMPPGYYLLLITLTFWPASLFLWHALRWGWLNRRRVNERFLMAWIIPTWIFFELMPSKLPQYILPVFPALAILAANAISDPQQSILQTKFPKILRALYLAWAIFSIGLGLTYTLIPLLIFQQLSLAAMCATLVTITLSISAIIFAYQKKLKQAARVTITMAVFTFMPIYQFLLPGINALWISKNIAAQIALVSPRTVSAQTPLLAVGYEEPSLVFQLGTYNVKFTDINTAIKQLQQHPQQLLLITKPLESHTLQTAHQRHITLTSLANIHGFNYSKGRWVDLIIYRANL